MSSMNASSLAFILLFVKPFSFSRVIGIVRQINSKRLNINQHCKMKKLFIVSAFILFGIGDVCAQQGQRSEEERAQMRTEMIKRVAERTAKDFNLKGDSKDAFMKVYEEYQTGMFQTNAGSMRQRPAENDAKKELSDE